MPILLLDLDRTLFDTSQFIHAVWQVVAQAYKLDLGQVMGELRTYYHIQNELVGYYNFRLHLQDRTNDASGALHAIQIALAGRDFVFADALALLQCRPSLILTCGEDWFQRFKLEFAPSLKGVPVEIILKPKRDYIASHFAGRCGWLVDDKPNQNLPKGFIEIQLDRSGAEQCTQKAEAVFVINSLVAACQLVQAKQWRVDDNPPHWLHMLTIR